MKRLLLILPLLFLTLISSVGAQNQKEQKVVAAELANSIGVHFTEFQTEEVEELTILYLFYDRMNIDQVVRGSNNFVAEWADAQYILPWDRVHDGVFEYGAVIAVENREYLLGYSTTERIVSVSFINNRRNI